MTTESETPAAGARTPLETRSRVDARSLRVVRVGHGGNCSSVGSVIDTLFLGAAAGGAIFAAICAALQDESIVVVREEREERDAP